ncbi:hypothetical protein Syun_023858 [Stephania yunnanensis]|uniref:Uncharacterized protein n=1 Tax=Stephania yunnanensis TaxID=152371 RepID=A0AAP0I2J1_9MAGN
MSTQSPDTSIDEDAVYLQVVPEVKGRVYGLGSQGYHRSIFLGEATSSRGPTYGPHELEELHRGHQRLQETLLKKEWNDKNKCRRTRWNAKKKIERCRTVCAAVAFGIDVAYREEVDKDSLFSLGKI